MLAAVVVTAKLAESLSNRLDGSCSEMVVLMLIKGGDTVPVGPPRVNLLCSLNCVTVAISPVLMFCLALGPVSFSDRIGPWPCSWGVHDTAE